MLVFPHPLTPCWTKIITPIPKLWKGFKLYSRFGPLRFVLGYSFPIITGQVWPHALAPMDLAYGLTSLDGILCSWAKPKNGFGNSIPTPNSGEPEVTILKTDGHEKSVFKILLPLFWVEKLGRSLSQFSKPRFLNALLSICLKVILYLSQRKNFHLAQKKIVQVARVTMQLLGRLGPSNWCWNYKMFFSPTGIGSLVELGWTVEASSA